MRKLTIQTGLVDKETVFETIVLAHAVQMPILLIGEKGTAKTNVVIDYVKSFLSPEQLRDELFLTELTEDSKPSDILGKIDVAALTQHGLYKKIRPITKSKVIIINEVDKGSTGVRNSMLSVMNEKRIYDGEDKLAVNWELFVATCNEIPEEEKTNHFWDRFILKVRVNKTDISNLIMFMQNRHTKISSEFNLPTMQEIEAVSFNYSILVEVAKMLRVEGVSDRTITKLDLLIKATIYIFNLDDVQATLKVISILCPEILAELSKKLSSKEEREVMSSIDTISKTNDSQRKALELMKLNTLVSKCTPVVQAKYNSVINKITKELETAITPIKVEETEYEVVDSYPF